LPEVLEYESTLELKDRGGKRAIFKKREKVRYLQDNVIAYQDQAWGNGEILIDYRCSPGTAYVEHTHLTMRLLNGRLARKTLAFSKLLEMYRASAAWEDLVYSLARPLKTLRVEIFNDPSRHWKPRTPAMAAGLTDHIWTVKELLTTVVPPNNT